MKTGTKVKESVLAQAIYASGVITSSRSQPFQSSERNGKMLLSSP